ncbi:MAG TPA: hypothetical protein VF823_07565 [Anaerolineales bacterium]
MKPRKAGKRYTLLTYRHSMSRLWTATLLLGLVLAAAGGWSWFSGTPLISWDVETWLLVGSGVCLAFSLFAFLARGMAYVQAYADHLRLVTPFLKLRISYRRMIRVHPASVQQLFPPLEAGWAQRRFLEPFFGETAVVIELTSFPLAPALLRLFLPSMMFLHQTNGLVLLVPDWMAFSTELDSFQGAWLQMQGRRVQAGRLARG